MRILIKMNITILSCARLGNFLMNIRNAIHIGLHYNYNILLPKHPLFNTTYIVINKTIKITDKQITDKYNFFYQNRILNIDNNLFNLNKDKVDAILKQAFIFRNIYALGHNDLVIHIRSGDIFGSSPHSFYLMPPLTYYTNIIEQNNFDNIYLIAEDTLNPCINHLLKLFPQISFKIQPLEKDIEIVLAAKNIIISYGTFIPQLLELSDNITKIYVPSYFKYDKPGCETIITELSLYHKCMIPWKNTAEQRGQMLTYKC